MNKIVLDKGNVAVVAMYWWIEDNLKSTGPVLGILEDGEGEKVKLRALFALRTVRLPEWKLMRDCQVKFLSEMSDNDREIVEQVRAKFIAYMQGEGYARDRLLP